MTGTFLHLSKAIGRLCLSAVLFCGTADVVLAQNATSVQISIKNHKFEPAEIKAPAGKAFTIRIKNLDPTPAEFESVSLRVEKVIAGNGEGIINVRPLQPGRYNFFDDFNQSTQGTLVVQ